MYFLDFITFMILMFVMALMFERLIYIRLLNSNEELYVNKSPKKSDG